ncbi:MAG: pyruvate kinase alpha/beta domain-containing protein [Bacillota bacterium]
MYWSNKGSINTAATVEAALSRARELALKHIVVASCSGATAAYFIGTGLHVVCVTHQIGFQSPGADEMPPDMRDKLERAGIKVLTATHLMAGLDRAFRFKFGGVYPAEMVAAAFRMFGQGAKVCVEISTMALDAGLIPFGVDVVAVAGTASGADTALVIRPAHSQHFFDGKIREIICKPRDF